MAKEKVGEIRISKRIVRIGHEVYPLANISRVQTLRVVWGGKLATFYPLREIAVLVLVVGAIYAAAVAVLPELDIRADFDVEGMAQQFATIAAALAGVRTAWLMAVLLYRLLIRRPRYALVVETAGTQYTALSGTDRAEIHRIEGEIVDAIEDPPSHERIVQISGDLVMGDKVGRDKHQQSGIGNTMTSTR
ncbi:DUF6232 family protein [Microbispora sp. NPDC049125]|uniref:DUF6232 family protein n=1 Tax=Microbispora sp. NPDC049125 TaxID=3154929 RepID=UPI0034662417